MHVQEDASTVTAKIEHAVLQGRAAAHRARRSSTDVARIISQNLEGINEN